MKSILALLGVSSAIWLAAPASGDPGDGFDDAGFLATVRSAGLTYTNADQAIAFARSVCGWIAGGKSGPEVVQNLQDGNPGLATDHASKFVAISAKYYCPQQLARISTPSAQ